MRRGFTIIELVMVVAIIGVLLGIVTTAAAGAIRQARERKADACCRIVQAGFETYYAQRGEWPIDFSGEGERNAETRNGTHDSDVYQLSPDEVRDMMKLILKEYKNGNPCLDVSGLFVSDRSGTVDSRNVGMDFWMAVHGDKRHRDGQQMQTSQMYFGYPESRHGYFRNFKVVYSKPADRIKVSRLDKDWTK